MLDQMAYESKKISSDSSSSGSDSSKSSSQIREQIDSLFNSISSLQEVCNDFEHRLLPVLINTTTGNPDPSDLKKEEPLVPMAEELCSFKNKINTIQKYMKQLLNRIEL